MVSANDFFSEDEKMHLAQITSTFTLTVEDKDSFENFLFTLRQALTHEEAVRLLAMAAVVIAHASAGVTRDAAILLANIKATEN